MATCLHPLVAVSLCEVDGKKKLKFFSESMILAKGFNIASLKAFYGEDNVYLLPCGSCDSCRINYSQEWAVRCTCESFEHSFNYFLTLTFDDLHIQYAGYDDFKKFIDRMQKFDSSLKYFGCIERGELTNRLHFHVVLFMNKELPLIEPVKLGSFYHYHSPVINDKWTFGLHDISPFEHNCASYVAKYTGKDSKCFMSRNLGKSYFLKNYPTIIDDGFKLYGPFNKDKVVTIPRCFVNWFKELECCNINDFVDDRKKAQHIDSLCKLASSGTIHEEFIYKNKTSIEKRKRGV